MEENTKEVKLNKMAYADLNKLTLSLGIPMIMAMVLQAFYNIVDSYFVSRMSDTAEISNMGDYAVNALTLVFPVQMLMVAIGVGTGIGVNALLSRYLGMGDKNGASKIAGNAIFLGICMYVLFLMFGIFGVDFYLNTQTSDQIIIGMGKEYLSICLIMSFGIIFYLIYQKLLQATGKTIHATIAQIAGAAINIVLDPILIFGLFGFSEMGMKGAAYATVIGQIASGVLNMLFHYSCNKEINGSLKYLKPEMEMIKGIFKVGFPAIIMQALMSFLTYGVNIIFSNISIAAVTAYGVYYKIQQFIFFAAFGLSNVQIPIVAFNFGMKDKKRVNDGIKYGMIYTILIMLIGMAFMEIFASQIAGMFALSEETVILCTKAIRIISIGYFFVGANISFQAIFQALDCGVHSLIVSLLRLIIITLPLAWLITGLDNADMIVWVVFPVGEVVAFIVAVIFMRTIKKSKIECLPEKDNVIKTVVKAG